MKKFRKLFALTCALALFCATAFPSSAFENVYNPYDDIVNVDGLVN